MNIFLFLIAFSFQENIKTKHPQLLYESKLYKVLQGGSNFPSHWVYHSNIFVYHIRRHFTQNIFWLATFIWQLGSLMWDGLALKESTMCLWWIYWALVSRICSISAVGNCPSKLFSCLLIRWSDFLYCLENFLIHIHCFLLTWGNLERFADKSSWIYSFQIIFTQGHKARQLPHGFGEACKSSISWIFLSQFPLLRL